MYFKQKQNKIVGRSKHAPTTTTDGIVARDDLSRYVARVSVDNVIVSQTCYDCIFRTSS